MIYFLKKIKYFLQGRILKKPDLNLQSKWFGNQYGGFFVCIENLNKNSIVYSLGIGTDVSFDEGIIKEFNCKVYGYDPTPKSIKWVYNNVKEKKFKMHEFGISNKTEKLSFYLPKNKDHVSGSLKKLKTINLHNSIMLDFRSIKDVMNQNSHSYINLLKMDIEGAEYDILEHILNEKINIDQIVVEFHPHLLKKGKKKTLSMIQKLNKYGYKCFAISDSYLEFSFIKI